MSNLEPPAKATEDNSKDTTLASAVNLLLKGSAIIVGAVYLCGFLSLNGYLYKYGVVGLGIGNTNYIIVGSIFILYMTCYGIFGGRAIFKSKNSVKNGMERLISAGRIKNAKRITYSHESIDLTFMHCLSAVSFTSIAMNGADSFWFYTVLIFSFIVIYPLDVSNMDIRRPYLFIHVDSFFKLVAIFAFFILPPTGKHVYIFFAFIAYSMYINMVLDYFDRYKTTSDKIIFTALNSCILVLASAISFGTMFYGSVSRKIGGGELIPMRIGINDRSLLSQMKTPNNYIDGEYIYSSDRDVILKAKNKNLVIPRKYIEWMQFSHSENLGILKIFGHHFEEKAKTLIKKDSNQK